MHTKAALLIVFLLCSLAAADQLAESLANFDESLNARIDVNSPPLLSTPQTITVGIVAYNRQNSPMPLYVIRQGDAEWEVVRLIGALAPNATSQIDLEIEVHYDKLTSKKTRYALVGRSEDGFVYGKFFEIDEDWSAYEKGIRDSLSGSIVTWAPITAALMILLILATAKLAYSSKSEEAVKGEYTIRTLLFPEITGRPLEEKLADIMINPITMAFELVCVGVLVLVMFEGIAKGVGFDEGIKIMALSAIGAFVIPFVYFVAAWYFGKREESKPLRFFVGMFVWGMFAAFISLLISSTLLSSVKDVGAVSFAVITTILIAPVVEETVKGAGILLISGHHDFNDALTGLLLGFTCGMGFAFVENWFYFAFRTNPFEIGLASWAMLIIYRSFFNTLAHGFFTATVSTMMGYCRGTDRLRKYSKLVFVPGIFMAIGIHMIYNLSALTDSFVFASRSVPFFVFNPMLIILLATMFFLVLVFAIIDEKKRKEAKRLESTLAFQQKEGKGSAG